VTPYQSSVGKSASKRKYTIDPSAISTSRCILLTTSIITGCTQKKRARKSLWGVFNLRVYPTILKNICVLMMVEHVVDTLDIYLTNMRRRPSMNHVIPH
jgi:hypothetical protein